MKRIYLILMSLAVIMLSACSADESLTSAGNNNSPDSKLSMRGTLTDTRVIETDGGAGVNTSSMTTSWAKTDMMAVVYNAGTSVSPAYSSAQFETTDGAKDGFFQSTNSFTQDQIDGYINNSAIAMNKTNAASNDTITATQTSINTNSLTGTVNLLDKQNGTLGNVSHYDLIYASSTSNGVNQKPFEFKHAMSVIRIDLSNLSTSATYIKSATITYTPSGSTSQLLATSVSYAYDGTTLTQSAISTTSVSMTCPTGGSSVASANQVKVSGRSASLYLVVPGNTATKYYSGTLVVSVTDNNNVTRGCNIVLKSKTLSPGSLYAKAATVIAVGMYYFSDGTWGTLAENPGKTPIAVIFSITPSTTDMGHNWTHGYAMALKNAAKNVNWGTYGTDTSLPNSSDKTSQTTQDMDGYTNTQTIKNTYALSTSNYPAFYYALNYGVTAPRGSSKWFLPSIGQWYLIAANLGGLSGTYNTFFAPFIYIWGGKATAVDNSINAYLSPVSGSDSFYYYYNSWYWGSTEADANNGTIFQMLFSNVQLNQAIKNNGALFTYGGYVRPAIAF